MSIVSKNSSNMDNEECFKLWAELGSLEKVGLELQRRGKFNTKTGKPFTNASISLRAHKWVFNHPDEAKIYYINAGSTLTDEQWERWMVEKAMYVYKFSPRQFFRWIEKMDFEKFEYMYEPKFGTLENFRTVKRSKDGARY